MRKSLIYSLTIAAMLVAVATTSLAQRPLNPNRGQNRLNKNDQQMGRPRDQFPNNPQRNRGPLGLPQPGGMNNPNVRRELQRRVMQAIGLTPQQHMRMQEIRRSHEDEAIAAGRRLRQSRAALDRAIMSEQYNEALINQAIEEFAAAQAEKARLESRVRAELRSVLTSEQVVRYHELERQFRQQQRKQQMPPDNEIDREMGVRFMDEQGPPPPPELEEIDLFALLFWID